MLFDYHRVKSRCRHSSAVRPHRAMPKILYIMSRTISTSIGFSSRRATSLGSSGKRRTIRPTTGTWDIVFPSKSEPLRRLPPT